MNRILARELSVIAYELENVLIHKAEAPCLGAWTQQLLKQKELVRKWNRVLDDATNKSGLMGKGQERNHEWFKGW